MIIGKFAARKSIQFRKLSASTESGWRWCRFVCLSACLCRSHQSSRCRSSSCISVSRRNRQCDRITLQAIGNGTCQRQNAQHIPQRVCGMRKFCSNEMENVCKWGFISCTARCFETATTIVDGCESDCVAASVPSSTTSARQGKRELYSAARCKLMLLAKCSCSCMPAPLERWWHTHTHIVRSTWSDCQNEPRINREIAKVCNACASSPYNTVPSTEYIHSTRIIIPFVDCRRHHRRQPLHSTHILKQNSLIVLIVRWNYVHVKVNSTNARCICACTRSLVTYSAARAF